MNVTQDDRLVVTSSPHIIGVRTTRGIMLDVIIALLPAAAASLIVFGWESAVIIAVCVASCVLFEYIWQKSMQKTVLVGDLSAAVTGLLLAFNLPARAGMWWQAVLGSAVAIIVVKQLFGGIGCNFLNPALAGRVVLAVSFTSSMTSYAFPKGVDAVTSATPLAVIASDPASAPSLLTLFLGNHGGVLGETSALALLIGFAYLLIRKVISPIIPVTYVATTALLSWAFGCELPVHAALSGGLLLGAVFMATDYTTSPYTKTGRLVYGVGCGILTALIRSFASSAEGVSYAILLMNLVLPYVNDLTRRKPFGTGGKA